MRIGIAVAGQCVMMTVKRGAVVGDVLTKFVNTQHKDTGVSEWVKKFNKTYKNGWYSAKIKQSYKGERRYIQYRFKTCHGQLILTYLRIGNGTAGSLSQPPPPGSCRDL